MIPEGLTRREQLGFKKRSDYEEKEESEKLFYALEIKKKSIQTILKWGKKVPINAVNFKAQTQSHTTDMINSFSRVKEGSEL